MKERPNGYTFAYSLFIPYKVGKEGRLRKMVGFKRMKERRKGHKFKKKFFSVKVGEERNFFL